MKLNRIWIAVALLAGLAYPSAAQTRAMPFQPGDRILLNVEGDSILTDTFTVVAGPALRLPNFPDISLAGVNRSELEPYLRRELSRYINDPVVHARGLIRVSVDGEVTKPGFYAMPVDLVLADALMVAGGATHDGRIDQLRIQRSSATLWEGPKLQAEIARGATLDELGMRAGDQIEVPRGLRDPESKWRIAGLIVSSLATAVGIIALTHR